jgi:antitoxin ParD1/3/4
MPSEDEMMREGLQGLTAGFHAIDQWLHHRVGPAVDALKANPTRALTAADVRARLAAEHHAATTKK